MLIKHRASLFVLCLVAAAASCKLRGPWSTPSARAEDPRAAYVSSAFKTLTRTTLSTKERAGLLAKLEGLEGKRFRVAAIREIMATHPSEYHEMVFDLFMYFLDFQKSQYFGNESGVSEIVQFPAAIHAVRSFIAHEDFTVLFDYRQPSYLASEIYFYSESDQLMQQGSVAPPLGGSSIKAPYPSRETSGAYLDEPPSIIATVELPSADNSSSSSSSSSPDSIAQLIQRLRKLSEDLQTSESREAFCAKNEKFVESILYLGRGTIGSLMFEPLLRFCPKIYYAPQRAGYDALARQVPKESVEACIDRAVAFFTNDYPKLKERLSSGPKTFADLAEVNARDVGRPYNASGYSSAIWTRLTNNSTQRNFRRASYILRTYYCDALQPLNLGFAEGEGATDKPQGKPSPAAIAAHVKKLHASDQACRGCHYKLNPLGGMFRSIDGWPSGFDFAPVEAMTFFDVMSYVGEDYRRYVHENWWNKETGEFEIGLRKEPDGEIFASMGGPEELHRFMRQDPEVYQCFVRRTSDYFLGKNQAVSLAWLNTMADDLYRRRGESSAVLDNIIVELVASETFSQLEFRDPNRCYDETGRGVPPGNYCQVETVVKSYCVRCHHGRSPDGGLDMSSWDPVRGFRHDVGGTEIAKKESLLRIRSRLSNPDPGKLMPLDAAFPDNLRQRLSDWIDHEIAN